MQRFAVFFIIFLLLGCQAIPVTPEKKETPPQVLLSAGKKLGIDFSDSLFAKQKKCYDDPFYYYPDLKTSFRAICYSEGSPQITIFWARGNITLENFVKTNIDILARERAKMGYSDTDKRFVIFIEEKNGVQYHSFKIDNDFSGIQGTLLIKTKEADDLGLHVFIIVKGKNPEAVRNRMEKMKEAVGR